MGTKSLTTDLILSEVRFEWEKVDDFFERIAERIPPGQALRAYNDRLERNRKRWNNTSPSDRYTERDKINSGRKHLLNQSLRAVNQSNQVQLKTIDDVRYIRNNRLTADDVDARRYGPCDQ